ncbi:MULTISPECIES: hypothetical protein [Flavobacterium]|uniref:Lipoprotein n=1 Tax=Flavobacterium jumunjinense TaxID=998845 RepID=A0ABV5GQY4_9FLAO|nr:MULTISPECIES: hypothetical protein [Flavobacterium]
MIKKAKFSLLVLLFVCSCQEKIKETHKSYEELKAEVLCDVLPEIIPNFVTTFHLLPPPPYVDTLKLNNIQEEILEKNIIKKNIYIDSLKNLAFENKKLKIGLMNYLIEPDLNKDYKSYNFVEIKVKEKQVI